MEISIELTEIKDAAFTQGSCFDAPAYITKALLDSERNRLYTGLVTVDGETYKWCFSAYSVDGSVIALSTSRHYSLAKSLIVPFLYDSLTTSKL